MRAYILAAMLGVSGASDATDPTIRVVPSFVMEGHDLHIRCRVPPRADNIAVAWGVTDYLMSSRQLDGDQAPVTWESWFPHIPCEADEAVCAVFRTQRRSHVVRQSFTVICHGAVW